MYVGSLDLLFSSSGKIVVWCFFSFLFFFFLLFFFDCRLSTVDCSLNTFTLTSSFLFLFFVVFSVFPSPSLGSFGSLFLFPPIHHIIFLFSLSTPASSIQHPHRCIPYPYSSCYVFSSLISSPRFRFPSRSLVLVFQILANCHCVSYVFYSSFPLLSFPSFTPSPPFFPSAVLFVSFLGPFSRSPLSLSRLRLPTCTKPTYLIYFSLSLACVSS